MCSCCRPAHSGLLETALFCRVPNPSGFRLPEDCRINDWLAKWLINVRVRWVRSSCVVSISAYSLSRKRTCDLLKRRHFKQLSDKFVPLLKSKRQFRDCMRSISQGKSRKIRENGDLNLAFEAGMRSSEVRIKTEGKPIRSVLRSRFHLTQFYLISRDLTYLPTQPTLTWPNLQNLNLNLWESLRFSENSLNISQYRV